jgi:PPOX class probable F420-dependent enzyme
MPMPPVPDSIGEFLAKPNPAAMATVRADGQPILVATWYLWEEGRILLNMDRTRRRVARLAEDPRVSLIVLAEDDWSTYVSLQGQVTETRDDADLTDITRLAMHHSGQPFPVPPGHERVSFLVDVDRWHGWGALRS